MKRKSKSKEHSARFIAKKLLNLFGPKGEHWTRGAFAKAKNGEPVSSRDPRAVKFCILGGINHLGLKPAPLMKALKERRDTFDLINFNDSGYYARVRKFLQEVAEA